VNARSSSDFLELFDLVHLGLGCWDEAPRRRNRKTRGPNAVSGLYDTASSLLRPIKVLPMGDRSRFSAQRQRLAYEAARIMLEQNLAELDRARRKAADRVGVVDRRCWPKNQEIQEALLQQLRLFQRDTQPAALRHLREQALAAMRNFNGFTPRLVGPVLHGTADSSQGIRLHVFADSPEELVMTLLEQGIPWRQHDENLRFGGGVQRPRPVFTFVAGETPFELVVLPLGAMHNPPFDPVSERPEKGAGLTEVESLVSGDTAELAPR
jgi:hypothetical protein